MTNKFFIVLIIFFVGLNASAQKTQTWQELTTFDGSDEGELYGMSIDMQDEIVVVGASEKVNVLEKTADGWERVAELLASDGGSLVYFGTSVAIHNDVIAVGADGSNAVYIFEKPVGGWSGTLNESAKLTSASASTTFGVSIDIFNNLVVVGAYDATANTSGNAFIFEKPVGGWTGNINETTKLIASDINIGDGFGISVAIHSETIIVGSWKSGTLGKAYVYTKQEAEWTDEITEVIQLSASDGEADNFFGRYVSIDNNTAVIGAHNDNDGIGAAYVFETSDNWSTASEVAKLTSSLNNSIYLGWRTNIFKERITVAGHASKIVYVFDKPTTGWETTTESFQLNSTDAALLETSRYGWGMANSDDIIVVGAREYNNYTGKIYLYEKGAVGINELNNRWLTNIYPNPTHGTINIERLNNENITKLMVLDITGKIIQDKKDIEQNVIIDLSEYQNGIYFIKIQTEKQIFTTKVIKQ